MKTINAFYDNSEFKDAEFSEPRNIVLSKSLAVEKYMSMYLAAIMDIENYLDSKSFGNTSSALSFNQKLNLFSDLEYVTKEEKIKLISFSEIRNQFAHNSSCLTFGHAFNVEVSNKLNRFYEVLKEAKINEQQYTETFNFLYEDIKLIFQRLRSEVYNNKASEFLAEYTLKVYDETIKNINKNSKHFNIEILNKIIPEVGRLVSEEYGISNDTFRTDIRFKFGKYLKEKQQPKVD